MLAQAQASDERVVIIVAIIGALGLLASAVIPALVAILQGRKTRDKGTAEHLTNATIVGSLRSEIQEQFGSLHQSVGAAHLTAAEARDLARQAAETAANARAAIDYYHGSER